MYCVEQSDADQRLVKFSVQLKDEKQTLLGQWDLDLKHGLHVHRVIGGVKDKQHLPFKGGIVEVALEIAARIRDGT